MTFSSEYRFLVGLELGEEVEVVLVLLHQGLWNVPDRFPAVLGPVVVGEDADGRGLACSRLAQVKRLRIGHVKGEILDLVGAVRVRWLSHEASPHDRRRMRGKGKPEGDESYHAVARCTASPSVHLHGFGRQSFRSS